MKTLLLVVTLAALPAPAEERQGLIQLKAALDEPEYYCLDVPGFRANVQLEAPLMAHTCKPGAADELFTIGHPSPGQLFMPAYKLCVQAEDNQLFLKPCSGDARQRFTLSAEGKLQPTGSNLCMAIAPGKGAPTGGPSHLRRDLALKPCADTRPELSRWNFGVSSLSVSNH